MKLTLTHSNASAGHLRLLHDVTADLLAALHHLHAPLLPALLRRIRHLAFGAQRGRRGLLRQLPLALLQMILLNTNIHLFAVVCQFFLSFNRHFVNKYARS